VQDVCTKPGVFWVGQSNGDVQISVRPALVATATRCCLLDTRSVITQCTYEITPKFGVSWFKWRPQESKKVSRPTSEICVRLTPVAIVMEIWKFSHKIYQLVFQIGPRCLHQIEGFVSHLIKQNHLPVTWSFYTPVVVSYKCHTVTEFVSLAIFEIMGPKHIHVMNLTLQGHDINMLDVMFVNGHVTSPVTWPFDSQYAISCWCPTGTKPPYLTLFQIIAHKYICATTFTFRSCHVTGEVTIWYLSCMQNFLARILWTVLTSVTL